jgi:hypothetical protein
MPHEIESQVVGGPAEPELMGVLVDDRRKAEAEADRARTGQACSVTSWGCRPWPIARALLPGGSHGTSGAVDWAEP